MSKKMPIGTFVVQLQEAVARKDGYIMWLFMVFEIAFI